MNAMHALTLPCSTIHEIDDDAWILVIPALCLL